MRRRLDRLEALEADVEAQALEKALCALDPVHFIETWGWTFDPRLAGESTAFNSAWLIFELWPKQCDFLTWLDAMCAAKKDGLCEKSRDSGFTWLCAAWAVQKWLFHPGFDVIFGSRKLDLVDKIGDPKTIFSKIRMFISRLPPWMLPEGYDSRLHDNYCRIVNPATGNSITGEGGADMGRGARGKAYIVDEGAFLEHDEDVDRATSATADTRIWGSTVNGPGNLFYRKRHDGRMKPDQIFIFDINDDPRKTPEWQANKEASLEPHVWASEYKRDYSASVEGICIPAKWVESATKIYDLLLEKRGIRMEPSVRGICGLDVGAGGKGKSVAIGRFGPIVTMPEAWGDPDTTETANRGLDYAESTTAKRADGKTICRLTILNFDSPGVGAGVASAIKKGRKGIITAGINTGVQPSDRKWPDGETSEEKFANLKAELWFLGRERFKATHQMVLFLEGKDGGHEHPISDLISLPPLSAGPEAAQLIAELGVVKWNRNEKGKYAIETKIALAKRGVKSPDYADALMLTMQENSGVADFLAAFGGKNPR